MANKKPKSVRNKKQRKPNVFVQENIPEDTINRSGLERASSLFRSATSAKQSTYTMKSAVRQSTARRDIFVRYFPLELKRFSILTGISVIVIIILSFIL